MGMSYPYSCARLVLRKRDKAAFVLIWHVGGEAIAQLAALDRIGLEINVANMRLPTFVKMIYQ